MSNIRIVWEDKTSKCESTVRECERKSQVSLDESSAFHVSSLICVISHIYKDCFYFSFYKQKGIECEKRNVALFVYTLFYDILHIACNKAALCRFRSPSISSLLQCEVFIGSFIEVEKSSSTA